MTLHGPAASLLLAALALAPAASAARAVPAREAYVLVAGADTIAVERFTSVQGRLEGDITLRSAGMRVSYDAAYDAAGFPIGMRTATAAAGDPSAAPVQTATFEFRRDSVIAVLEPGGRQSFATAHDAQPYLNPSMAMIARAVRHARAAGRDSSAMNLFMLAGGRTLVGTVASAGPDSVVVRLANVVTKFGIGPDGELRGGRIPSQGVTVVRGAAGALESMAAPDYSAPADAPYTAEEVRVPCPGGFALAGTLTRPKTPAGRVPCVLTLTGSGLEDRDEALPGVKGYRPFRQVADALARAGIATLRLDDRGFGASGGDGAHSTTADFAADARTALAWLRARPDVDGARLALLGHSEGGIIAPMVAADDRAVRAVVLLAGPSWTGRRVIAYQNRLALERHANGTAANTDSLVREAVTRVDSLATQNPWLRFFLDYDPLPAARRVRCPALVMQGATDHQVDPSQAAELAAALRGGGNRDVTLDVLPDVDHLFLADPGGEPSGYASLPEKAIRPEVLATITDWLRARLAK